MLEELARLNLDVTRPGEESIPVGSELMLQNEMTRARTLPQEFERAWYVSVVETFARNQRLRNALLFAAAVLVLISFTFFHASQDSQFRSGVESVRDGAS